MKYITKIMNKHNTMSDNEFKEYLIMELKSLESEYQKTIIYSLYKYDKFSRYLDKSKVSSIRRKLRLLQKEADKILGFDSYKYDDYSYMLIKYDYKYNLNVFNLVSELKWCEDTNKKYELLKEIKSIYRSFFVNAVENRLESKKSLKEINSFINFINDKYKVVRNTIKNNKKSEKEDKKKEISDAKYDTVFEKIFDYSNINYCDINEILTQYRDNIREGKIDKDLVKVLLLIIKRLINEELKEDDVILLHSIMDSIKYKKNSMDNEDERLILNSCSSILKKYIELQELMNTEIKEPHDYKFDIVLELLKDKENYSIMKNLVNEYPQIVNVRNNKKSILIYILMIYINNYKMILKDHRYDYNVDYIKEVYRLFSNSNSLYLSYEDKKEIDSIINNYISEITDLDISPKKQNYAINEVLDLKIENVIKERKYLKKVDKKSFDSNINDIYFYDYNHISRPGDVDLTDEHTFMLNDPYTCYSYSEEKGIKSLKIHTADISNIVDDNSSLDNYIYNCMISKKGIKKEILDYLKFKEGDTVSAFTYEIDFDNDRNIKDFKIYKSKIKVDGDILNYNDNEYIYQNLRRVTTDYIQKNGDVSLAGLAKIEYILNSILQKEFIKVAKNNNLPKLASKVNYKEGLSKPLFSYFKKIFCKLDKCEYRRLSRIFESKIEEEYYDNHVKDDEEYNLHLTGTPDFIHLINQRMIKELLNNEYGYDGNNYRRIKENTMIKYDELKDTLNDILNYKSEEDFDYKKRRNFKTYILTKEE